MCACVIVWTAGIAHSSNDDILNTQSDTSNASHWFKINVDDLSYFSDENVHQDLLVIYVCVTILIVFLLFE